MNDVVYKGFDREEVEFHFNPSVATPIPDGYFEQRAAASAAARARVKGHLDVAYGARPREKIDIFPAAEPNAPVNLFIHGGYWRLGSKDDYSFMAETFVAAGATLVVLGYDLCPDVTLSDIVRQTRAGIAWAYRNLAEHGVDPSRFYLSGMSAGGHLVAMALAHDWASEEGLAPDFIKGAVIVSGVLDVEPVPYVSVNELIRLTPEQARLNSPMRHPPLCDIPLVVMVGGDEPDGWRKMGSDYAALCRDRAIACEYIEVPGAIHFSLIPQFGDPDSLVARTALGQMGR